MGKNRSYDEYSEEDYDYGYNDVNRGRKMNKVHRNKGSQDKRSNWWEDNSMPAHMTPKGNNQRHTGGFR